MSLRPVFPESRIDDATQLSADELRACIRDLLGLLALPAVWRERDARAIFSSLLEALESVLPLAFAHVRVRIETEVVDLIRVDGRFVDDPASPWRALTDSHAPAFPQAADMTTPAGPLRATYVPLGYHGARGYLVFASPAADFPTLCQTAVLKTAASLADSAAETTRILQQREQALRAKDEFLAMLGHELRNPLAPIATAVQLLQMRAGAEPPRELAVIDRQVRALLRLVDDLLDLARVTRGKIELQREPCEINQLLAKALETASPWLDRAGHRLYMDVDPSVIVDVDAARMAQVFANLLTNAAKYTPSGGEISVSVRKVGRTARVSVTDTGIGIPMELQPAIFDMFVQAPRSRARSEGGLGIGLALVKSFVNQHGGTVDVHSNGAGTGSTFTVTLALTTGPLPQTQTEGGRVERLDLANCRVLVVDDNVDAAALLGDVLRSRGAIVTVVHDSFEALAKAVEVLPHVALLDIGLPVMDGYELMDALRARLGAALPRVFALTGYGQESDRARSRAAGFAGHFVKPVDVEALIAALRSAVQPSSGAAD